MANYCSLCNKMMESMVRKDHCPHCNQPSRTRLLPIVLDTLVSDVVIPGLIKSKPLLGFAMTSAEKISLSQIFPVFTSASLYGNYGKGHIEGCDVRDLSRFSDNSFCGVFSILLFDYFVEIEDALAECARVTAPGGVFITFIANYRLVDGEMAPTVASIIKKTETYFQYIPDDANMPSIKLGRQTFVNAMERVGYQAEHHGIHDEASGEVSDYFIGFMPTVKKGISAPIAPVEKDLPPVALNEKTYGIPLNSVLNPNHGRSQSPFLMSLRLSVPSLPKEAKGTYFAEHVYDRKLKSTTAQVILAGRSIIVESKDNGVSWVPIRIPEVETRILYNCFTTDGGNHLVQAKPEKPSDNTTKATNPEHATIFFFDQDWKLLSVDDTPGAIWHGRASIDQSGDTIMFAEYHDNPYKYLPDYRDDYAKWRPLMKVGRVFRSRDGGHTWDIVFEGPPELIRHFHTLQADPFLPKTWWLSSGDRAEESRVWRSNDDGDSWVDVTHPNPEIILPVMYRGREQAAFRYTDLVIDQDWLMWGSDDLLGNSLESGPEFAQAMRAGSRIYRTKKTNPLQIEELGYIGHPVRSIVDVGPAYLFITEANRGYYPLKPQIIALFKDDMAKPIEIARIDNFKTRSTGFSYSKASKAALDGRFFSFRNPTDVFNDVRPCLLQWDIEFSN